MSTIVVKNDVPISPSIIDGTETLRIEVDWVNGYRNRVTVEHTPVGAPNQTVVVSGRSTNDLMRSFARFLDYKLVCTDNSFNFVFKE